MAKIKVKIEVPSGGYCENEDIVCRMCLGATGEYAIVVFLMLI